MAITPEEREARKSGLGSSDIARIMCGHSVDVALEKLASEDDDYESVNLDDAWEIRIGKIAEPLILSAYEKRMGCELEKSPPRVTHPEYPYIFCHLDSRWPGVRTVEAKTCGHYRIGEFGDAGTDQVPDYELWQAHVFNACENTNETDIAVCFVTMEATRALILRERPPIHIYKVQRDFELEAMLIRKATMVWEYIQAGCTPPPENLEDVKRLYRRGVVTKTAQATEELYDHYLNLIDVNDKISDLEKKKRDEQMILQSFMKDAGELRYGDRLLATWKNDRDGEKLDMETLMNDYEEVYKDCLVPKRGARKFLPKKPKERDR